MFKRLMLVAVLVLSTVQVQAEKNLVDLTITYSSFNPSTGDNYMTVQNGSLSYFVKEDCVLHCHLGTVGAVVTGDIHLNKGWLEIINIVDGKQKTYRYKVIEVKSL